jgi:hypothetical protein
MARGLTRVKKAAEALRPGRARVANRAEQSLGPGPTKAPATREAVVVDAVFADQVNTADYSEFHNALGDQYLAVAVELRTSVDAFREAFAEASAAHTYEEAAPRWPKVGRLLAAALDEAASLIERGLLAGVTLSARMLFSGALGLIHSGAVSRSTSPAP